MNKLLLAGCCSMVLVFASSARSQGAEQTTESTTIDEVLVAGEYPGPGLWKISKQADDGEHVLWIFGTLGSPIPEGVKWKSREVEQIAAESQEIISGEGVRVDTEKKVGMFTALTLIPGVLRARKNPDDKTLQDVLPPDVYTRWLDEKARYIGKDKSIETWRPVFAAEELRQKAVKKLNRPLSAGPWSVIGPIAKEHKIKVTRAVVVAKIPNGQIRPSLKSFSKTPLQDARCLDATMTVIDALADEKALNARAAAWARGNLQALRELPEFPTENDACISAVLGSQVVQDLHLEGFDDLTPTRQRKWMEVIEQALASNRSTLVLMSIDEALKPEGRLAILRAKGYRVEDPV